jgi:hypothetical protein
VCNRSAGRRALCAGRSRACGRLGGDMTPAIGFVA